MFWYRKVQVIQKDREAADALYADIVTFGKRNRPALAAAPKPQLAAQAHSIRDAQPDVKHMTVLQIHREDGERRQIKFIDLERAMRQARILHGCGYEVLIHHSAPH
jgi:hypothetical protein